MPKNDPTLKNAPIADESTVDATPETPADVTPPEVRYLSEREPRSYAERMERELRMPRSAEGAVIISALVELHRAGLHDGTADGRYLKAARVIGDALVEEILGPSEGATR